MKSLRIFTIATVVATAVLGASAIDIKGLFGGNGSSSSSSSNALSGLLSTVQNLVGGTHVDLASLTGNWKYTSPAISFESDNFLQKAGGEAASHVIIGKLEPYYKKAGINKMTVEFGADSTFVVNVGKLKASGTISDLGDGVYQFNFQAFSRIPTGSIKGYMQPAGNDIRITFNATKLLALIQKIASVSGNGTLQAVSSLLSSYDGMNIGVQLTRIK